MQHKKAAAIARDPHHHSLGYYADGGTDRVGHVAVVRKHDLATQPSRHLGVINLDRPAHRHHGQGRLDAEGRQAKLGIAAANRVDQLLIGQLHTQGGVKNGKPGQAHRLVPDIVRKLLGAFWCREFHLAQAGPELACQIRGLP